MGILWQKEETYTTSALYCPDFCLTNSQCPPHDLNHLAQVHGVQKIRYDSLVSADRSRLGHMLVF